MFPRRRRQILASLSQTEPLTLTEDEAAAIGGPGGVMHDHDSTSPD